MTTLIYKIADRAEFERAASIGRYDGARVDLDDGFIHFSTGGQLRETARLHFAGKDDLLLIAVDSGWLGDALRFEPSRGGDLFPHLYAALDTANVEWATPLRRDAQGELIFPDGIA